MTRRDGHVRIAHMLEHAREAAEMAAGTTREGLDEHRQLNLALVRLLEIVGEAANRVPAEERAHYPEVPWQDIVDLRNRLIHGYDSVDFDILWQILQDDLPKLIESNPPCPAISRARSVRANPIGSFRTTRPMMPSRAGRGETDLAELTGTRAELLGHLNDVEAKHAPERLYLRGDAGLLQDGVRVSVVGSRRASDDGLRRARRIARLLVSEGITVVSGLALGVDAAAHGAAIEAGGRTIAVLGAPLDEDYPRQNRELRERIGREHLLVSQFPPGYPIRRGNFPQRNRTMALISDATVIVEAGETSGSLSQGWEALRLGRPLFIMRSLIDDASLDWPHEMIEYGAYALAEPEDLLEVLPSPAAPTPEAIAL